MLRVATLDKEHCKPDDCGIPCYRFCPEVLNRRYAIKFVPGKRSRSLTRNSAPAVEYVSKNVLSMR